jgi:hypothetical protein
MSGLAGWDLRMKGDDHGAKEAEDEAGTNC